MNIYELTGRHIDITDAIRNYVNEKLEPLESYNADIVDAKVVLSYSGNGTLDKPHKVEIQLNLPNTVIRAEERSRDAYQAINKATEKLETQLKRHQDRFKPHHKSKAAGETDLVKLDNSPILASNIARVKKHALRPMTPEDAVFQMEFLGHAFYMFHNSYSDTINVVYVRHDGTYGLLQPS